MITYLCGGINGLTDAEAKNWREYVKARLGTDNCLDPMRRDYRGREDGHVEEIVELDKQDIDNSDIVLVNATRPSWGTAMELLYAYQTSAFVVAVCPSGPSHPQISPWITYHADIIVGTLDGAVDFIKGYSDV